jgi:hypothetical protein
MHLINVYENRTMKPVEIALRSGRGMRENDGGELSTYGTVTMNPPVQLIYANNC